MNVAVARRSTRSLALALAPLVAAGCLKTSSANDAPQPLAPDSCDGAPAVPAGQAFSVSGNVTYDFVPARYFPSTGAGGLFFGNAYPKPVREAAVEIRQCGAVLATTATDAAGHYAATFTPVATGQVAVYVLARVASPPITVRDNATAGSPIWAAGVRITDASGALDVHATHGWTGTGYGPGRIAAPFAILDTMYTAAKALLAVRDVPFDSVPLTVNWSPANTYANIVSSYYWSRQIWVLGDAGVDTDEFDREVIAHEWGHYLEDNFSRSDSPGGGHGFGDVLDPRLAFDEGAASALAAILLQDPIYADTGWVGAGQDAFGWDAETAPDPTDDPYPGPFSEFSVIRALYDLYDGGSNETYDRIAVGLGPLYDTFAGPQRTTRALTTIAPFVAGLKQQPGVDAAAVNAVLAEYNIGPITSDWGDGDASLRAMYTDIAAPTSTPLQLNATFSGGSVDCNERAQNHYYVFTAAGARVTVQASATYDVDLEGYDAGLVDYRNSPSNAETLTFATTPGQPAVVVLTGCGTAPGTYTATATFSAP